MRSLRALLATCCVVLSGIGAAALVWSTTPTTAAGPVVTAAVVAASTAMGAVVIRRAHDDPLLCVPLSLVAVIFSATAGFLAVPAGPHVAHVLLASAAAFSVATILLRLMGCGTIYLTAIATATMLTSIVATSGVTWRLRPDAGGALLGVISLAMLAAAPRVSMTLAGAKPATPSADETRRPGHRRCAGARGAHPPDVDRTGHRGIRLRSNRRSGGCLRRAARRRLVAHGRGVACGHRFGAGASYAYLRRWPSPEHSCCKRNALRDSMRRGLCNVDARPCTLGQPSCRRHRRCGAESTARRDGESCCSPLRRDRRLPGHCGGSSCGLLGRRSVRIRARNEPDMTAAASRLARLLGAACLTALPLSTAPAAAAVTPPPIDDSLLPRPSAPAPPQRTEQQEPCAAAAIRTAEGAASQLKEPDLQSIWQLTRGAGQTVAVIDTGVSRHRLLPHLVPGGDYVSTGDGTEDCDGHGTIVAGIIGAAPDPATPARSAASHPKPRSSASVSRAIGSGQPTTRSAPVSAMSTRSRWRFAPRRTWARP